MRSTDDDNTEPPARITTGTPAPSGIMSSAFFDEDLLDELSELAKQAAVYKYAVLDEEPTAHMPPRLQRMLDNDDSNDALSCAWNTYEAGEDMAEGVYERRRSMKDIWGGRLRW
ncbi:hypothetical protein FOA52_005573 [Chlamydomonas sp. UWO 241]|nr:hypothetical protein FOA52_005573 [Chlamydomonas sp. UWO 241]